MNSTPYTPALGLHWMTGLYDVVVALFTRERAWRAEFVKLISPHNGMRILDVGCGTGTLAIALKTQAAGAEVIGIDPDPRVLAIASAKAARAGITIDFREGFLTDKSVSEIGQVHTVVSSLVLHQTPLDEKRRIIELAHAALAHGGRLAIADYGLQRTWLMRTLFRNTVQRLDGFADTQPNAEGKVPILMMSAGFADVREVAVTPTPTGSISFYAGTKL